MNINYSVHVKNVVEYSKENADSLEITLFYPDNVVDH